MTAGTGAALVGPAQGEARGGNHEQGRQPAAEQVPGDACVQHPGESGRDRETDQDRERGARVEQTHLLGADAVEEILAGTV